MYVCMHAYMHIFLHLLDCSKMFCVISGTQLLGQVDRLDLLDKLCREKEIWLHVEG